MERLKPFLITVFILLLSPITHAAPHYGATLSSVLIPKEPMDMHGYQFMLDYDPQRFQWRAFNIYFDGGVGYFWVSSAPHYRNITIYSAAPVIRYTFKRRGPVLPYLDISIGVAYLNHTQFTDRNLDIHFSFQDRLGVGAIFGLAEHWSAGVHAAHYSNAALTKNNAGITIPLFLDVSYRFG